MTFTDRYLQKLQPREKMFEVLEGDGFTLRVLPSGRKSFYYCYKAAGVNRRVPLGIYPHVTLAEARARHRELITQRERGLDPALEKKRQAEEAARRMTVAQLAGEYLEKHAKPRKRSWKADESMLNNDVLPAWGARPAEEIRKRDVIVLLEGIVRRGAPNQSNQVLKIVRKMFNFAVERDLLEASPCAAVKPLAPSVSRERALSVEEIRLFWAALEASPLEPETVRALRLVLVTGQRPGECAGLRREEIEAEWWTLPAERTKNGREHSVYLTPLALELIGDGKAGPVFTVPARAKNKRAAPKPLEKSALGRALRRLLARKRGDGKPVLPVPAFTPHDLRRTCATQIAALGYDNDQIGRLLNHVDSRVTAVYNRHRYDDLKREMLTAWEARLREIVTSPAGECTKTP